jgi:hypothetical protein
LKLQELLEVRRPTESMPSRNELCWLRHSETLNEPEIE